MTHLIQIRSRARVVVAAVGLVVVASLLGTASGSAAGPPLAAKPHPSSTEREAVITGVDRVTAGVAALRGRGGW